MNSYPNGQYKNYRNKYPKIQITVPNPQPNNINVSDLFRNQNCSIEEFVKSASRSLLESLSDSSFSPRIPNNCSQLRSHAPRSKTIPNVNRFSHIFPGTTPNVNRFSQRIPVTTPNANLFSQSFSDITPYSNRFCEIKPGSNKFSRSFTGTMPHFKKSCPDFTKTQQISSQYKSFRDKRKKSNKHDVEIKFLSAKGNHKNKNNNNKTSPKCTNAWSALEKKKQNEIRMQNILNVPTAGPKSTTTSRSPKKSKSHLMKTNIHFEKNSKVSGCLRNIYGSHCSEASNVETKNTTKTSREDVEVEIILEEKSSRSPRSTQSVKNKKINIINEEVQNSNSVKSKDIVHTSNDHSQKSRTIENQNNANCGNSNDTNTDIKNINISSSVESNVTNKLVENVNSTPIMSDEINKPVKNLNNSPSNETSKNLDLKFFNEADVHNVVEIGRSEKVIVKASPNSTIETVVLEQFHNTSINQDDEKIQTHSKFSDASVKQDVNGTQLFNVSTKSQHAVDFNCSVHIKNCVGGENHVFKLEDGVSENMHNSNLSKSVIDKTIEKVNEGILVKNTNINVDKKCKKETESIIEENNKGKYISENEIISSNDVTKTTSNTIDTQNKNNDKSAKSTKISAQIPSNIDDKVETNSEKISEYLSKKCDGTMTISPKTINRNEKENVHESTIENSEVQFVFEQDISSESIAPGKNGKGKKASLMLKIGKNIVGTNENSNIKEGSLVEKIVDNITGMNENGKTIEDSLVAETVNDLTEINEDNKAMKGPLVVKNIKEIAEANESGRPEDSSLVVKTLNQKNKISIPQTQDNKTTNTSPKIGKPIAVLSSSKTSHACYKSISNTGNSSTVIECKSSMPNSHGAQLKNIKSNNVQPLNFNHVQEQTFHLSQPFYQGSQRNLNQEKPPNIIPKGVIIFNQEQPSNLIHIQHHISNSSQSFDQGPQPTPGQGQPNAMPAQLINFNHNLQTSFDSPLSSYFDQNSQGYANQTQAPYVIPFQVPYFNQIEQPNYNSFQSLNLNQNQPPNASQVQPLWVQSNLFQTLSYGQVQTHHSFSNSMHPHWLQSNSVQPPSYYQDQSPNYCPTQSSVFNSKEVADCEQSLHFYKGREQNLDSTYQSTFISPEQTYNQGNLATLSNLSFRSQSLSQSDDAHLNSFTNHQTSSQLARSRSETFRNVELQKLSSQSTTSTSSKSNENKLEPNQEHSNVSLEKETIVLETDNASLRAKKEEIISIESSNNAVELVNLDNSAERLIIKKGKKSIKQNYSNEKNDEPITENSEKSMKQNCSVEKNDGPLTKSKDLVVEKHDSPDLKKKTSSIPTSNIVKTLEDLRQQLKSIGLQDQFSTIFSRVASELASLQFTDNTVLSDKTLMRLHTSVQTLSEDVTAVSNKTKTLNTEKNNDDDLMFPLASQVRLFEALDSNLQNVINRECATKEINKDLHIEEEKTESVRLFETLDSNIQSVVGLECTIDEKNKDIEEEKKKSVDDDILDFLSVGLLKFQERNRNILNMKESEKGTTSLSFKIKNPVNRNFRNALADDTEDDSSDPDDKSDSSEVYQKEDTYEHWKKLENTLMSPISLEQRKNHKNSAYSKETCLSPSQSDKEKRRSYDGSQERILGRKQVSNEMNRSKDISLSSPTRPRDLKAENKYEPSGGMSLGLLSPREGKVFRIYRSSHEKSPLVNSLPNKERRINRRSREKYYSPRRSDRRKRYSKDRSRSMSPLRFTNSRKSSESFSPSHCNIRKIEHERRKARDRSFSISSLRRRPRDRSVSISPLPLRKRTRCRSNSISPLRRKSRDRSFSISPLPLRTRSRGSSNSISPLRRKSRDRSFSISPLPVHTRSRGRSNSISPLPRKLRERSFSISPLRRKNIQAQKRSGENISEKREIINREKYLKTIPFSPSRSKQREEQRRLKKSQEKSCSFSPMRSNQQEDEQSMRKMSCSSSMQKKSSLSPRSSSNNYCSSNSQQLEATRLQSAVSIKTLRQKFSDENPIDTYHSKPSINYLFDLRDKLKNDLRKATHKLDNRQNDQENLYDKSKNVRVQKRVEEGVQNLKIQSKDSKNRDIEKYFAIKNKFNKKTEPINSGAGLKESISTYTELENNHLPTPISNEEEPTDKKVKDNFAHIENNLKLLFSGCYNEKGKQQTRNKKENDLVNQKNNTKVHATNLSESLLKVLENDVPNSSTDNCDSDLEEGEVREDITDLRELLIYRKYQASSNPIVNKYAYFAKEEMKPNKTEVGNVSDLNNSDLDKSTISNENKIEKTVNKSINSDNFKTDSNYEAVCGDSKSDHITTSTSPNTPLLCDVMSDTDDNADLNKEDLLADIDDIFDYVDNMLSSDKIEGENNDFVSNEKQLDEDININSKLNSKKIVSSETTVNKTRKISQNNCMPISKKRRDKSKKGEKFSKKKVNMAKLINSKRKATNYKFRKYKCLKDKLKINMTSNEKRKCDRTDENNSALELTDNTDSDTFLLSDKINDQESKKKNYSAESPTDVLVPVVIEETELDLNMEIVTGIDIIDTNERSADIENKEICISRNNVSKQCLSEKKSSQYIKNKESENNHILETLSENSNQELDFEKIEELQINNYKENINEVLNETNGILEKNILTTRSETDDSFVANLNEPNLELKKNQIKSHEEISNEALNEANLTFGKETLMTRSKIEHVSVADLNDLKKNQIKNNKEKNNEVLNETTLILEKETLMTLSEMEDSCVANLNKPDLRVKKNKIESHKENKNENLNETNLTLGKETLITRSKIEQTSVPSLINPDLKLKKNQKENIDKILNKPNLILEIGTLITRSETNDPCMANFNEPDIKLKKNQIKNYKENMSEILNENNLILEKETFITRSEIEHASVPDLNEPDLKMKKNQIKNHKENIREVLNKSNLILEKETLITRSDTDDSCVANFNEPDLNMKKNHKETIIEVLNGNNSISEKGNMVARSESKDSSVVNLNEPDLNLKKNHIEAISEVLNENNLILEKGNMIARSEMEDSIVVNLNKPDLNLKKNHIGAISEVLNENNLILEKGNMIARCKMEDSSVVNLNEPDLNLKKNHISEVLNENDLILEKENLITRSETEDSSVVNLNDPDLNLKKNHRETTSEVLNETNLILKKENLTTQSEIEDASERNLNEPNLNLKKNQIKNRKESINVALNETNLVLKKENLITRSETEDSCMTNLNNLKELNPLVVLDLAELNVYLEKYKPNTYSEKINGNEFSTENFSPLKENRKKTRNIKCELQTVFKGQNTPVKELRSKTENAPKVQTCHIKENKNKTQSVSEDRSTPVKKVFKNATSLFKKARDRSQNVPEDRASLVKEPTCETEIFSKCQTLTVKESRSKTKKVSKNQSILVKEAKNKTENITKNRTSGSPVKETRNRTQNAFKDQISPVQEPRSETQNASEYQTSLLKESKCESENVSKGQTSPVKKSRSETQNVSRGRTSPGIESGSSLNISKIQTSSVKEIRNKTLNSFEDQNSPVEESRCKSENVFIGQASPVKKTRNDSKNICLGFTSSPIKETESESQKFLKVQTSRIKKNRNKTQNASGDKTTPFKNANGKTKIVSKSHTSVVEQAVNETIASEDKTSPVKEAKNGNKIVSQVQTRPVKEVKSGNEVVSKVQTCSIKEAKNKIQNASEVKTSPVKKAESKTEIVSKVQTSVVKEAENDTITSENKTSSVKETESEDEVVSKVQTSSVKESRKETQKASVDKTSPVKKAKSKTEIVPNKVQTSVVKEAKNETIASEDKTSSVKEVKSGNKIVSKIQSRPVKESPKEIQNASEDKKTSLIKEVDSETQMVSKIQTSVVKQAKNENDIVSIVQASVVKEAKNENQNVPKVQTSRVNKARCETQNSLSSDISLDGLKETLESRNENYSQSHASAEVVYKREVHTDSANDSWTIKTKKAENALMCHFSTVKESRKKQKGKNFDEHCQNDLIDEEIRSCDSVKKFDTGLFKPVEKLTALENESIPMISCFKDSKHKLPISKITKALGSNTKEYNLADIAPVSLKRKKGKFDYIFKKRKKSIVNQLAIGNDISVDHADKREICKNEKYKFFKSKNSDEKLRSSEYRQSIDSVESNSVYDPTVFNEEIVDSKPTQKMSETRGKQKCAKRMKQLKPNSKKNILNTNSSSFSKLTKARSTIAKTKKSSATNKGKLNISVNRNRTKEYSISLDKATNKCSVTNQIENSPSEEIENHCNVSQSMSEEIKSKKNYESIECDKFKPFNRLSLSQNNISIQSNEERNIKLLERSRNKNESIFEDVILDNNDGLLSKNKFTIESQEVMNDVRVYPQTGGNDHFKSKCMKTNSLNEKDDANTDLKECPLMTHKNIVNATMAYSKNTKRKNNTVSCLSDEKRMSKKLTKTDNSTADSENLPLSRDLNMRSHYTGSTSGNSKCEKKNITIDQSEDSSDTSLEEIISHVKERQSKIVRSNDNSSNSKTDKRKNISNVSKEKNCSSINSKRSINSSTIDTSKIIGKWTDNYENTELKEKSDASNNAKFKCARQTRAQSNMKDTELKANVSLDSRGDHIVLNRLSKPATCKNRSVEDYSPLPVLRGEVNSCTDTSLRTRTKISGNNNSKLKQKKLKEKFFKRDSSRSNRDSVLTSPEKSEIQIQAGLKNNDASDCKVKEIIDSALEKSYLSKLRKGKRETDNEKDLNEQCKRKKSLRSKGVNFEGLYAENINDSSSDTDGEVAHKKILLSNEKTQSYPTRKKKKNK